MSLVTRAFRLLAAGLALATMTVSAVRGQDGVEPLVLQGGMPGGLRTSVTESWGTLQFTVTNRNATGRDARVLVLFPSQPDVQYGRDFWVPPESSISGFVPVGPAPSEASKNGRDIQVLLYDRSAGLDRLLLPPGEQRVRSRAVAYRRREPTTAILLDNPPTITDPDALAVAVTSVPPALIFARNMRQAGGLSELVSIVPLGFVPQTPVAFDSIDHFVLASDRLAADTPGRQALRRWVQQGGKLWVMLDLVDPAAVASILGNDLDIQVVDRIGLTTVRLRRQQDDPKAVATRELDYPVDLVRVLPSPADRVVHIVNGWPASFVRQVGRGKVLFTTLGPNAWQRPRMRNDPPSTHTSFRDYPVPLTPLAEFAAEFRPRTAASTFSIEDLRPLLTEEIGYSVIDRSTVAAILAVFVSVLLCVGIALRRTRRPELLGWLGAAAAVIAAGTFVVLGESSRRAVPPTLAVAELVDAVPGNGEGAANGLFAMYRPASGSALIGSQQDAELSMESEDLAGQIRRRVQTDLDSWHWENLSIPAGVRSGPIRYTARAGGVAAMARFGPDGVDGRLTSTLFREPADGLMITAAREPIAVRFSRDGSFTAGSGDGLSAGQFISGTVLTDRQQRRQDLYRRLLSGALPEHLEGRSLLMAWTEPAEMPMQAPEGMRSVGTALLMVPLEFERTPAATRVTVPSAFVPYRRVLEGRQQQPTLESTFAIEMRLRFQMPPSVVPMTIERAALVARVRTPGWRFSVTGHSESGPVLLQQTESPVEPVRVEIADAQLLKLDPQGGLHLTVAVSAGGGERTDGDSPRWKIESLSLEVVGQTSAEK